MKKNIDTIFRCKSLMFDKLYYGDYADMMKIVEHGFIVPIDILYDNNHKRPRKESKLYKKLIEETKCFGTTITFDKSLDFKEIKHIILAPSIQALSNDELARTEYLPGLEGYLYFDNDSFLCDIVRYSILENSIPVEPIILDKDDIENGRSELFNIIRGAKRYPHNIVSPWPWATTGGDET